MGIGLSEGAGKGLNVWGVTVGLRTFPIIEKPLVAAGGPREVTDDGGSEDPGEVDKESVDDENGGKEDGARVLAGG